MKNFLNNIMSLLLITSLFFLFACNGKKSAELAGNGKKSAELAGNGKNIESTYKSIWQGNTDKIELLSNRFAYVKTTQSTFILDQQGNKYYPGSIARTYSDNLDICLFYPSVKMGKYIQGGDYEIIENKVSHFLINRDKKLYYALGKIWGVNKSINLGYVVYTGKRTYCLTKGKRINPGYSITTILSTKGTVHYSKQKEGGYYKFAILNKQLQPKNNKWFKVSSIRRAGDLFIYLEDNYPAREYGLISIFTGKKVTKEIYTQAQYHKPFSVLWNDEGRSFFNQDGKVIFKPKGAGDLTILGNGTILWQSKGYNVFINEQGQTNAIVTNDVNAAFIKKYQHYTCLSNTDQAYLINGRGKTIYGPGRFKIHKTFNKYLLLKVNGKLTLIDKQGNTIIEPKYNQLKCSSYGNNFARPSISSFIKVKLNGKWGVYHIKKKLLIPVKYSEIILRNSLILVKENNKWGAYNSKGKFIIPCVNDQITLKNKDVAFLRKGQYIKLCLLNNGSKILDKKFIIPTKFQRGNYGPWFIYEENGKYGLLSKKGKILTKAIYDTAPEYQRNRGIIKINGKYGLIDEEGNFVLNAIYDKISITHSFFHIKNGELSGFVDRNGQFIANLSNRLYKVLSVPIYSLSANRPFETKPSKLYLIKFLDTKKSMLVNRKGKGMRIPSIIQKTSASYYQEVNYQKSLSIRGYLTKTDGACPYQVKDHFGIVDLQGGVLAPIYRKIIKARDGMVVVKLTNNNTAIMVNPNWQIKK